MALWHTRGNLRKRGWAQWGAGEHSDGWVRSRCADREQDCFAKQLVALRPYATECKAFRLGLG